MVLTPRSFFNIVLKIFGLFFLREIINEIPATISIFVRYYSTTEAEGSLSLLIISLLILCFYTFLTLQLLFRTNKIIEYLKLDKGFFEHEFTFEQNTQTKIALTPSEVLLIALTIIGGYILVDEIPDFCKHAYMFLDQRKSFYLGTAPSIANLLSSGSKILLALLILGERNKISGFILNKKSEEIDINN